MKHGKQKGPIATIPLLLVLVVGIVIGAIGSYGVMHFGQGKADADFSEEAFNYIETPYGNLQYPAEFENVMYAESVEDKDGYRVVFSTEFEEETIPLYSICFGGGRGVTVGTLTVDGERVSVSVETHEYEFGDEWTQDAIDDICAMQESVNDVLLPISESSDFVSEG